MEVKRGYKYTEVGIIPRDWEVKRLGVVANIKTGPFGSSLHERDYVDDGTPIITVEHLSDIGIVHENLPMVSNFDRTRLNTYELQLNDIVFSRVGSVDRNSLITKKENGWLFSGRLLRIRVNYKSVSPSFLSYYLNQEPTKQRIRSVAVGQTMASLNTRILNNFQIAYPPTLAEQTAIANALTDADALINSLEKLITKKRNIKQGAMQQLLTGRKRLPGFSGEWEKKRLGDLTNVIAGGTPSTAVNEFWGGEIKWMNSGELHCKEVFDVEGRITESGLRNSSSRLLPKNCILIGLAGQGKTRGTVAINRIELCTNQSVAAILPNDSFLPEFLYYNLDSRYLELRMLSAGEGGRGGLNLTIIKNLLILIPPTKAEQTAIALVLSDMDAEIEVLEQKLAQYRLIKQGMMQELLTGKKRLV